uniref:Uncharacterized protein n=1 Tax=Cucumis sativus TaxID=3659 RepID=A0A0A0LT44_CUCSA
MDGVLPTEEYMEEELLFFTHERKELKKVQDELESYRNFYDLGEREVLMEEIQDLRSRQQYYIDSPSTSS